MTASLTEATNNGTAVIGAGIVGLCCARYLLDRGFKVEVIDPREPGTACSYGNAGVLAAWSCAPLSLPGEWRRAPKRLLEPSGPLSIHWRHVPAVTPWLIRFLRAGSRKRIDALSDAMFRINNPCVDLYRELLRDIGNDELIRASCYVYAHRKPEDASLDTLAYRLRRAHGARLRTIDMGELHALEPSLSPEFHAAVLLENQGRTVNPARLCKVIADHLGRRGAGFTRSSVHAVTPGEDGRVTLQLEGNTRIFDRVVLAAGAWSARLIEPLGVSVPLQSGRGYHVMFPDSRVTLNNSVVDEDFHVAASSMETGIRVSGVLEFAGLETPAFERRYRMLARLARRMFPDLHDDPGECWMGHRPMTPDSLPVIGALPDHPSILLAFGHGQLGLTGAPMTARIIAALASGERLNVDVAPYRVERFG